MSKFKSKAVSIVQIMKIFSNDIYGLGSDSKVYTWDYNAGGWLKFWAETELPE